MTAEALSLAPTATWLAQPHHDGSGLYVSDESPELGATVSLWLRVPATLDVQAVAVRQVLDGEPFFTKATVDRGRSTEVDTWWRARIVAHNPVTSYRWLLSGGPAGWAWVNGTGVHLRDVPDAADFRIVAGHPAPDWALDATVYQIFPDRFARSGAADSRPTPAWATAAAWDEPVDLSSGDACSRQLYGGDLDGIVEHLDHIADLGFDVVYLTPFFPARSAHRYDAHTFAQVDPVLGGDEALRRLTDAAHARGIRVLGDFTSNHTGVTHEWFVAAQRDPAAPERDFYYFDGDGYAAWLGVPTLPKLNHASPVLRQRIFDDPDGVVRKWLGPAGGLDGWRVDVANMSGRFKGADHYHQVARDMRTATLAARPDGIVVAEHCHDVSTDLVGDGWHGVMNYMGFTRPVWTWLADPDDAPEFLGQPVPVPHVGGDLVAEAMRDFGSRIAWSLRTRSFNLLGSHDTSRIRTLVGADARLVEVGAGLLFTMPGIPMVTYGDEVGMRGSYGEDGRRPMPWGHVDDDALWDARLHAAYRDLVALRRDSVALRRGGLRWVYAARDVLVYLREAPGETALVHVARSAHDPVRIDLRQLPGADRPTREFGTTATVSTSTLDLMADGPTVGVRIWSTAEGV
ncbi:MAG TPA: glycoside hydrolase family 13 protein [Dermatophilaceae bacterium]|nr:glycoside hydrolase family 13 protein [Dermatophilaceae bacterium]